MKIEPRELVNIVADAAKEIVNENPEMSNEVLKAMKLMTQKITDKLYIFDVSDLGLSEEEIKEFMTSLEGGTNA